MQGAQDRRSQIADDKLFELRTGEWERRIALTPGGAGDTVVWSIQAIRDPDAALGAEFNLE